MRTIMIALLGVTLTLTACGEGSAFDESFKSSYREKFVLACAEGAKGTIPEGVNIDIDKICGCTADKVMAGKSVKDLATQVPGGPEDLPKIKACVGELYPDGVHIGVGK